MESKCQVVSILSDSLVIQLKGANRHEIETLVKDTDYRIKLVKWHEKRSLDSNAYLWLLCSKIAEKIQSTKEEVYEQMLFAYGTIDEEVPPITVIADVDMSKFSDHFFKFDTRRIGDKDFNCYLRVKGSSEMDSKEMSRLIDGVVLEAKQLGIETMTPDQIAEMNARWGDEINTSK